MSNNQETSPNLISFGDGANKSVSPQIGLYVRGMFNILNDASISAKVKLQQIASRRSAISISDMFEMQMLMNHLSQLSEMTTNVVSAAQTAIMSMARNVKG